MSEINLTLEENLQTAGQVRGREAVIKTAFNEPRQAPNPGELLAQALGACMLTMIGYLAGKRNENVTGTTLSVVPSFDEKHTRLTGFTLTFVFPQELSQVQKDFYATAAARCPVHNSLREDMTYKVVIK